MRLAEARRRLSTRAIARKLDGCGAHERLEALPVEAEHAARYLRADGGRAGLPGQQRHLAEEVPGAEPVDPPGRAAVRVVDVDAQPSRGEHEQAVARLALAADGVALLEHDRIEMGGQLGERDPVDLGEERDPGEGVLQAGRARPEGRPSSSRHADPATRSGR